MMSWLQYHYGVMDRDKKNAFQHQKSLILLGYCLADIDNV